MSGNRLMNKKHALVCLILIVFGVISCQSQRAGEPRCVHVDFSKSEQFCPTVTGDISDEMRYFETYDPDIDKGINKLWETASPSGKLYLLLYCKYRNKEAYVLLSKIIPPDILSTQVYVVFGDIGGAVSFGEAVKLIEKIQYDWAGNFANFDGSVLKWFEEVNGKRK